MTLISLAIKVSYSSEMKNLAISNKNNYINYIPHALKYARICGYESLVSLLLVLQSTYQVMTLFKPLRRQFKVMSKVFFKKLKI